MWQPTHVQVTVQRAKGLLYKGKNDTNDAFVVIALGKEKFQTSIKPNSTSPVEWHEECDLEIPRQGNTASVQLTVYHRNGLGMDEFLGQMALPLSEFDVYERPRTRSYKLRSKPDKARKKPEKERGELEAKISFIVKSGDYLEVNKKEKHKSSLTSLKNIGGSLLSLGGGKDKHGLKKFTKSVSNRMDKLVPKKKNQPSPGPNDDFTAPQLLSSSQWAGQADPGVISDDEEEDEFGFGEVKVTSGGGSSTVNSSPYSVTSRTSSGRRLPQPPVIPDDDSLAGIDYPPPQAVHHHAHNEESSNGAVYLQSKAPPASSPSSTQHSFSKPPTPPASFTSTSSSNSKPQELTHSNNEQHNNDALSHPSPPPSPDLTINYANMTPVELPPPARTSSSFSKPKPTPEHADANTTNKSTPYNPFDDEAHSPNTNNLSAPKKKVLPSPISIIKDNKNSEPAGSNPFEASGSTNPFDEGNESFDKTPLALKNSDTLTPKLKTVEDKVGSLPYTSSSPNMANSATGPPVPHRRLSVPSTAKPAAASLSTPTTNFEMSRSSSQSSGLIKTDLVIGGSPISTHSGHSVGQATPAGGIGVRSAAMIRGGSVKEKRMSQPYEDEWERKLRGGRSMVGSLEQLSGGGPGSSRSSLSNSCASSTHDLHPSQYDLSSNRIPEVKALTLERSSKLSSPFDDSPESGKKHKRKGLKSRLFSKGSGSGRDRVEEEGRVVEGGNDKLPNAPLTNPHSRLPQEIHNKFSGKSREDLMEQIMTLQCLLEKNSQHTRDLEEYIDNLLLRVMDASPHILHSSTPPGGSTRSRFMRV